MKKLFQKIRSIFHRSRRFKKRKISLKDIDHNDKIVVKYKLADENFEVVIARFDRVTYLIFVNGAPINRLFAWHVRNSWHKSLGGWVKSAIEAYKEARKFLTEKERRNQCVGKNKKGGEE